MANGVVPSSHMHKKKLDAIRRIVLNDFKPTEAEMAQMVRYSNEIMARLKKVAPKDVEIVFVGSVARGTQIRGSSDIDIFLLFPRSVPFEKLEKKGLEIAKKIVQRHKNESFEVKYAEHPYLRLKLGDLGVVADIVPAYKIGNASEMGSSVDRTQLHNKFLMKNLTDQQKEDVIMLKAFLKSHNIYGAGARVEGLSGYLCELLIYHYGNFTNTITAISKLALPKLIDVINKKEYDDRAEAAKILFKKFNSNFVVLDPTDSNRNVAAVVTREVLARFVIISIGLLKNPDLDFFYGRGFSDVYSERKITRIRKELGLDVYLLHFKTPNISEEIIWQQLRKATKGIFDMFELYGFRVALYFENVHEKDAIMAFFIDKAEIRYTLAHGPKITMGAAVEKFMEAHPRSLGMFFYKDRIFSVENSVYNTPRDVFKDVLGKKYSFPSYLKKKSAKLYVNVIPEEYAKLLYEAFVKKMSI